MIRTLALALMLSACGPALPVFEAGEWCDCRRDLGVVGTTAAGECLECAPDSAVGRSASGITFHTNRCAMKPTAPAACGQ